MSEIEFQGFGKIARLNRDIVVTEKIDGTNGAIGIVKLVDSEIGLGRVDLPSNAKLVLGKSEGPFTLAPVIDYLVYAQSRKRIITPMSDNFGFARWVWDNADTLVEDLGEGLHFGEWWGSGIQRGYGLEKGDKRFSLFNVKRWYEPCSLVHSDIDECLLPKKFKTPSLGVVPVLYRGPFIMSRIQATLVDLDLHGSSAVHGFYRPEGVVVYHTAANELFKVTLLDDEKPKTQA